MTPGNRPPSDDLPDYLQEGLPEDPQAEALEALAAGELDAETARALEARLAQEPRLAALYDEARRLERMLREEPLLPLPLQLVSRILESTAPPRARPVVMLARVAALVLIFFASWLAFSGDVPAMADVAPHPRLVASLQNASLANMPLPGGLPDVGAAVFHAPEQAAADRSLVGVLMTTVVGLVLLVAGFAFALFSHLAAAAGPPARPPEGDNA